MKNRKSTILILCIIFQFSLSRGFSQSAFNINIFAQPLTSWVGDYKIPLGPSGPSPASVSLESKMNLGFEIEASLKYNFTEHLGTSIGVAYSKQGQCYEDYSMPAFVSTLNMTWHRELNLSYLKFPILFHYDQNSQRTMSFMGVGGFYFGYLVNYTDIDKITYSGSINGAPFNAVAEKTVTDNSMEVNININGASQKEIASFTKKPYNSADFGLILGVGVKIRLSERLSLPMLLNFQRGLYNIKDKDSEFIGSNFGNGSNTSQKYWSSNTIVPQPNETIKFYNTSIGLKIGLEISL